MFNLPQLEPLLDEVKEFKTILKDVLRELVKIKSYLKNIEEKK